MTAVTILSGVIANYNASPRVLTSSYLAGAGDMICVATVAAGASDGIGSAYKYLYLPSGVRIQDITLQNDATMTGVCSLGVYCNDQQLCKTVTGGVQTVAQPGTLPVANANLIFGAGISTAAANLTWKSVYAPTVLNGANSATNVNKRVWELLGLDFDPFYEFILALSVTTAPTVAGNISLQMSWVR